MKQWRLERSKADGVPAYVVFSDATLRHLARRRPTTDETLLAVPGIGPAKLAAYGEAVKPLLADSERHGGERAQNAATSSDGNDQ